MMGLKLILDEPNDDVGIRIYQVGNTIHASVLHDGGATHLFKLTVAGLLLSTVPAHNFPLALTGSKLKVINSVQ